MKKLVLILLAVFAFSILSGCIEPVDQPQPAQPTQPQYTDKTQETPELTPEQQQDSELMQRALQERNPALCDEIQNEKQKNACKAWSST